MTRFIAAPDDWPLWSGRKWWSVYCDGWRMGEKAAERLARKLNAKENHEKNKSLAL